jgi:hypothetical protein
MQISQISTQSEAASNDTFSGGSGIDLFADTLTGDGLANVLNDLAGNNKLNGAARTPRHLTGLMAMMPMAELASMHAIVGGDRGDTRRAC